MVLFIMYIVFLMILAFTFKTKIILVAFNSQYTFKSCFITLLGSDTAYCRGSSSILTVDLNRLWN